MEEVLTIAYKTIDGKLFESKEEAQKHEEQNQNLKAFKIFAYPDLTEGRSGPEFQGYLLVNAKSNHSMFAEHWCYEKYHNKIAFVMGVFGSNAIMENWYYTSCSLSEVNDSIIGKVQEDFVEKLW